MSEKATVSREPVAGSENGATAPDYPLLPALPDRIEEPELSAFRAFHQRVVTARAHLAAAEEALTLFSPIIVIRFGIGENDRISPDGTIDRS